MTAPAALKPRPAEESDREAVYALHLATNGSTTPQWKLHVERSLFDAEWERHLSGLRVVYDGPELVAAFRLERSAGTVNLASIDVVPSRQGQGIGTALLRQLMADASAVGNRVTLAVTRSNPRARALYERLGFAVERESPTHVFMVWSPPTHFS